VGPVRAGESPDHLNEILELAYRGRRISASYASARWDRMIDYLGRILAMN
jgi:hypothetical protein